MKFLLAILKTLTNSKIVPKAVTNFCSVFPLHTLVNFYQCTFVAGFRNNFQDHRRVTEQLLEAQAFIKRPEQVLEGILKL
jgi:hypothetical protein